MEEFVIGFMGDESLTPIDIVSDITGLTYDEIRSVKQCVTIELDFRCPSDMDMIELERTEQLERLNNLKY